MTSAADLADTNVGRDMTQQLSVFYEAIQSQAMSTERKLISTGADLLSRLD